MEASIQETSKKFDSFFHGSPAPFILASRLASYPSPHFVSDIADLINRDAVNCACAEATDDETWIKLYAALRRLVSEERTRESVAARYIDIFDRGSVENSLYETEYGIRRSQLKTGELADISGFYQAFGFRMTEESENREMLDHIAVECEFYGLLLAKQEYLKQQDAEEGVAIVFDARKKFLEAHLGRFPRAASQRSGVLSDPFYRIVFHWCADLIDSECKKLDVSVVPADYAYFEEGEEQMSCATSDDLLTKIGGRINNN